MDFQFQLSGCNFIGSVQLLLYDQMTQGKQAICLRDLRLLHVAKISFTEGDVKKSRAG